MLQGKGRTWDEIVKQQLWEATDTQQVWVQDTPHRAEIPVVKQERMRGWRRRIRRRKQRYIFSYFTVYRSRASEMSIKPNITHTRCHLNKQQRLGGWRYSQSIQVNIVWKCSIWYTSNTPNKNVFNAYPRE